MRIVGGPEQANLVAFALPDEDRRPFLTVALFLDVWARVRTACPMSELSLAKGLLPF
jgi:hypothetical protein